jgi:hypothetical protein
MIGTIDIGLQHAPFAGFGLFSPHLNMKKTAYYGPQQHQKLII